MIPYFYPKKVEKRDLKYKPIFAAKGIKRSAHPIVIEDMYNWWEHNILHDEGKLKKRYGYTLFGTETPLNGDPVMDIVQYYKYDGTDYLVAFTTKNAYKYNATTELWELITQGEVICDCQDVWTTSIDVTSEENAVWFRSGTSSVKILIDSEYVSSPVAYMDFTLVDMSGYTHLHFYINSNMSFDAGALQILLSAISDVNECYDYNEAIDLPAIVANVPMEVNILLSDPATCSAIISAALEIVADETKDFSIIGCEISISDIQGIKCFTGDISYKFNTAQIYDDNDGEMKFLVTNGVDPIQSWNGTGNFADLGGVSGSPNITKYMINFNHYLVLFHQTVSSVIAPQRVEWSQLGKPEHWTGNDSGNNSLAGTSDFIVGVCPIRSQLAIFKESSIALMTYVGGLDPFEFEEEKVKDIGCASEGSIQSLGESIIFLGWDNVYEFDGFTAKPIGNDILKQLIDNINPSKLSLIHSHIFEELNKYCLFVPSASSNYPDRVWVYDYVEERWSFWSFHDTFTASGFYVLSSAPSIGSLLKVIGSYTSTIGSKFLQSLTTISLFGDQIGNIYKFDKLLFNDNGNAIDAYFDTKSYILDEVNLWNRLEQLCVFGVGNNLSVYVSLDDGYSFTPMGTLSLNTSNEIGNFLFAIAKTGERFMIRLQNSNVDEWFNVSGWELGYLSKERVRVRGVATLPPIPAAISDDTITLEQSPGEGLQFEDMEYITEE